MKNRIKYYLGEWSYKFHWWLAWAIPKRAALYAFIRVYGADGEAPCNVYTEKYKTWCAKHNLGNV